MGLSGARLLSFVAPQPTLRPLCPAKCPVGAPAARLHPLRHALPSCAQHPRGGLKGGQNMVVATPNSQGRCANGTDIFLLAQLHGAATPAAHAKAALKQLGGSRICPDAAQPPARTPDAKTKAQGEG